MNKPRNLYLRLWFMDFEHLLILWTGNDSGLPASWTTHFHSNSKYFSFTRFSLNIVDYSIVHMIFFSTEGTILNFSYSLSFVFHV